MTFFYLVHLARIFSSRATIRIVALLSFAFGTLLWASLSFAVNIVDMNFDGVTGLENAGVGPAGVLKGGASVVSGQLVTDGSNAAEPTGAGLDLPLGPLSPFGGGGDFSVMFDFMTTDDLGVLFSADGSHVTDPDPDGQEGSLNIFIDGGTVVADFWFIEGVDAPGGPYNDGLLHNLLLEYDSIAFEARLSVDGGDVGILDFTGTDFPTGFLRDASMDITRLGDENNFDFGVEINDGCDCTFDNLLIVGPSAPPVRLLVDRTTGAMTLEVIATDPTTINLLSILSNAGTLDSTNYLGADANNPTFDPNDVWQIDTATDLEITESDAPGDADDGATLTSGQMFALGNGIWKPFFREDLRVSIFDTVLGETVRGIVEYVNGAPLLFADLDIDNDIDVDDYVLFRDGFSQDVTGLSLFDAYFLADLNGDEVHNFDDFIAFAEAFDSFAGAGSFARMLAGVPEPSSLAILAIAAVALLVVRKPDRSGSIVVRVGLVAIALGLFSNSKANADQLVEYLFTTDFTDTSSNGRTGVASLGTAPFVADSKLQLGGDFEEGLIVPLGAANPFGGLSDYSLEMTINSTGNTFFPDAGVVLFGSADATDPTNGDNQSLSIYVEPQADGGSLVVDYFFVGEVRIPDAMLLDGVDHSIKVTYVAPDDPGTEEEPNPGTMFINLDGEWLGIGEIAPRQPSPANHDVRIGGTLNEDFPFECAEGTCFTTEMEGTVDDFRVFDEEMAPSLLRAEVDLQSGDITMFGGEFHRDLRYYEIVSESGALNPSGWSSFEEQMLDEVSTDDGNHWDELVGNSSMLAEGFLIGSSLFDENRMVGLGPAFSLGGAQDLEFIAVTADLEDIPVEVSYVNAPPAVPGDYNENGIVDAADYTLYRDNLGKMIALPNEGVTPGEVTQEDYEFWNANFGNISGSGDGFAAVSGVPEPGSLLLVMLAGALPGVSRRVKRS